LPQIPCAYAATLPCIDLGLWKHTFARGDDFLGQVGARAQVVPATWSTTAARCPSLLGAPPAFQIARRDRPPAMATLEQSRMTRLLDLATLPDLVKSIEKRPLRQRLAVFALGLAAGALVIGLARRRAAVQAWCYLALGIERLLSRHRARAAYLPRYAWTMHGCDVGFPAARGVPRAIMLSTRLRKP
jgi:hypothetical protein